MFQNDHPEALLGAIWPAGPINAQNEPPEASWEPFGQQALELFK